MADDVFVVRVNRALLGGMTLLGLLFFRVGLDLSFLHTLFDAPGAAPFLGGLFFAALGGVIAANCVWYLLSPPVMLRLGPEGVSFGTGFRYHAYTIPWRHLKSVGFGADVAHLVGMQRLTVGAQFVFEPSPEVPAGLATSAGLGFMGHQLTLDPWYADRFPWTVVAAGKALHERYRGAAATPPPLPPGA